MTQGERNASYVRSKGRVLRLYLLPFLGSLPRSQVNAGRIQEYRLARMKRRDCNTATSASSWMLTAASGSSKIQVRGKRGGGYCKSMPGAITPFLRLGKRNVPAPEDLVFGAVQRELFKRGPR
jgi:hypothetical protein